VRADHSGEFRFGQRLVDGLGDLRDLVLDLGSFEYLQDFQLDVTSQSAPAREAPVRRCALPGRCPSWAFWSGLWLRH
jgi:hypothetical protein